jgi:hypothetical protein
MGLVTATNPIQVVHHVPGRLRVRVNPICSNSSAAASIESRLSTVHGIRTVTANPITGSVVVCYDAAQTSSESIIAALEEHSIGLVAHTSPPIHRSRDEDADQVVRWLAQKALEIAVEKSIVRLIAAVL